MAESAVHLVEKIFPHKPLRQWVISFPFQLRLLFAKDPKIMGEVLKVVNKLKRSYDNGTSHIILDSLDFLSRLASLVPRPRVNLTRFFGVLAPHFKYRSLVVPEPSPEDISEEVHKVRSMSWPPRKITSPLGVSNF